MAVKFTPNTDISEIPFLSLDFETTGFFLDEDDRIIEIGAIKTIGSQIVGEMNQLINPERDIPEKITELTGINQSDVESAPTFKTVFPKFVELAHDCIIVAHNASFDKNFLYAEIQKAGFDFLPWQFMCTLKLTRALWPHMENHKLQTLAAHFEIDSGSAHRAKDDALVCAKIFQQCLAEIRSRLSLARLCLIEKMGEK